MKVPVKNLTEGMVLANGHTVVRVIRMGVTSPVIVGTRDLNGVEHETPEAPDTKYEVQSIDITPTWSALLPVFVDVLRNDNAPVQFQKEAFAQLTGMAAIADKYVDLVKRGSGDTVGLTPVLIDPDTKEGNA